MQALQHKRLVAAPRQLLRNLAVAVIMAPIVMVLAISMASIVFAGTPSDFLVRGVGYVLMGTFLLNLLLAFGSSLPGVVIIPQDSPAAILGLVTAGIVGAMATTAPAEGLFATVLAAIILASLMTGVLMLVMGALNLGDLARYLPFSVIGGFLAGTGTLMVQGAVRSMAGVPVALDTLATLALPEVAMRWLPGFALGLILVFTLRRYSHFSLFPGILAGAVVVFYGVMWLWGLSLDEIRSQGWLLGPFPQGGLWQPPSLSLLHQVDWRVLGQQTGTLISIPLICIISLLLNVSGLELIVRREIRFNHELRLAGVGNIFAGLLGSHAGYHLLGLSSLNHRMRAGTRTTSLLIALFCGATLVLGAGALAYLPNFILGGIVLFVGFDFLMNWLVDARRRLTKAEYAILIAIVVAINLVGMLVGVGLGILVAVVLFVFDYSRVSVVRRTLPASVYHSNVDRPRNDRTLLHRQGSRIHIVELQGYIFFGTANQLLSTLRTRLLDANLPRLSFLILDFRHVTGLDASAVVSFTRMKQLAAAHEMVMVFTHLSPQGEHLLHREVLTTETKDVWRLFDDLDRGLEWCENQLLAEQRAPVWTPSPALEQLTTLLNVCLFPNTLVEGGPPANDPDHEAAAEMLAHRLLAEMKRRVWQPGEVVIAQGQVSQGIYFIESGQLTVQLEANGAPNIRLRTMKAGVFIGELSFYANTVASASVVVDEVSVLYFMSTARIHELMTAQPDLAAALHRIMAQMISERLLTATETLGVLLR